MSDNGLSESIVDDRVLFGMNNLVNELKIRDDEIEKKSNRSQKSRSSHYSQRSFKSKKNALDDERRRVDDERRRIDALFDVGSNSKDVDMLSNKSRRSDNWSKSSGRLNEDRNQPNGFLNELLGELPNKSVIPESAVYDDNQTIRETEVNNFTRPLHVHQETIERTPEEELDEKIKLINQYEQLTKKIKDREIRQFGIHSSADDIRLEIRKLRHNKKREGATKMMRVGTITVAKGIEQFFNINPLFSLDLNGFATHLRHNIDDFDDIFDELYDKYSSSGKSQPPEIRFIFTFLTTLVGFVMANSAPKAFFAYMNQNGKQSNVPQGGQGEMSPPDLNDPDIEEMIMDAQRRMEKKQV